MISIIIPTYNEEHYIGNTLDNLKSLTLPHELIVTDDKSTDRTVSIAQQYTDQVLVPDLKHATIAANRNAGAQAAHGEFLVFIDSSCLINDPDSFFTHAVKDFESKPDLVALTGNLNIYPETRTWGDRLMYFIFNTTHFIKNNILHTGEAPGKFQMIRRAAFEKVGGFNVNLVTREDADLFYRLSRIGRTFYDGRLQVLHSGRRAHAIGWIKLMSIWMINTVWFAVFGTTKTKNWERWWEKKPLSNNTSSE
ncbi:MAG TPA: glycosyltransferase [Candidatus Paceibacterota bacterium]|jgi:cellulose synthase/poly-beta-1,6-N-acetylglucosamine synthase-like glycosyltransferase|nr:glycosyltransferase [Candidatus Paceibacterota bacterium]